MIIPTHNKEGKIQKPYVISKDKGWVNHPEGRWKISFFLRAVIKNNKKCFKYAQLRHSGDAVCFKTREEAKTHAYYILGM